MNMEAHRTLRCETNQKKCHCHRVTGSAPTPSNDKVHDLATTRFRFTPKERDLKIAATEDGMKTSILHFTVSSTSSLSP